VVNVSPNLPSRRTPRAEVRTRVLDAAAKVFADRGFAEASIDDIAAAAGFTKGAVYSNFASKDELFFALMDQQIAVRTALAKQLTGLLPTGRALAQDIGQHVAAAISTNRDWQLLFVEYWQRAMRDPATRERFVAHRRELHRLITEEVQHWLDTANLQTTTTARSIMFALLGLSNGLAIEELLDPGAVPPNLIGELIAGYLADHQ
jgi:AcrR family transcriptional regulator